MDVVEVSPPFDHAQLTSLAAASIAFDLLCLAARSPSAAEGFERSAPP